MQWWTPLLAWLRSQGAQVQDEGHWEVREHTYDADRGVGLFATETLPKGTLLFAIPPQAIVNAPDRFELAEWLVGEILEAKQQNAAPRESPDDHPSGEQSDLAANKFCAATIGSEECLDQGEVDASSEFFDGEDEDEQTGAWFAYVESLPKAEEIRRMPKNNVFYLALKDQNVEDSKDPLVQQALDYMPNWILQFGLEREWLLSLALVSSRVHFVWSRDAFGDFVGGTALVPLADLLNGVVVGSSKANTRCETRREDANFICTTIQRVSAGEELLVEYGAPGVTAADFENTYGFSIDGV